MGSTAPLQLFNDEAARKRRMVIAYGLLAASVAVYAYRAYTTAARLFTVNMVAAIKSITSAGKGSLWSFYVAFAFLAVFATRQLGHRMTLTRHIVLIGGRSVAIAAAFVFLVIGDAESGGGLYSRIAMMCAILVWLACFATLRSPLTRTRALRARRLGEGRDLRPSPIP